MARWKEREEKLHGTRAGALAITHIARESDYSIPFHYKVTKSIISLIIRFFRRNEEYLEAEKWIMRDKWIFHDNLFF